MAGGEEFFRKATEIVEERTGEKVDVIGWGSRTGAMASVISGSIDALGGSGEPTLGTPRGRMSASEGRKGAKLPLNFLVVLTPTTLRLFGVRNSWRGVSVKEEVGVLPREGLKVEVHDAGPMIRFHLEASDGSGVGFEMARVAIATRFAEDLQAALA